MNTNMKRVLKFIRKLHTHTRTHYSGSRTKRTEHAISNRRWIKFFATCHAAGCPNAEMKGPWEEKLGRWRIQEFSKRKQTLIRGTRVDGCRRQERDMWSEARRVRAGNTPSYPSRCSQIKQRSRRTMQRRIVTAAAPRKKGAWFQRVNGREFGLLQGHRLRDGRTESSPERTSSHASAGLAKATHVPG